MNSSTTLKNRLDHIQVTIADACARAGRSVDTITLVAVTKYVTVEVAEQLVELGCHELGESRPQELVRKASALAHRQVNWHLVGHLQRNKVKSVLPLTRLIHSIDSTRLMDAIEATASHLGLFSDVLMEINISGEATKHGVPPGGAVRLIEHGLTLKRVRVRGLMGMSSLGASPDQARRQFASLRELREQLRFRYPDLPLTELSMGMSSDYLQAIAEGATIIRLGSILFPQ